MERCCIFATAMLLLAASVVLGAAEDAVTVEGLTQKLWPKERIEAALKDLEKQKADGLLSDAAYAKRKKMLTERQAGAYKSATAAPLTTPRMNASITPPAPAPSSRAMSNLQRRCV